MTLWYNRESMGAVMWLWFFACEWSTPVPERPVTEEIQMERPDVGPVERVAAEDILLSVEDWEQLARLEEHFSFERLLPHAEGELPVRPSTRDLYEGHQGYRLFATHVQSRVDAITNAIDRDLIVELHEALEYPAGNVGRRLDNRWFESDLAFVQLVGIVNRLDKKDFYRGQSCGEVRFVYRFAYQTPSGASSRLPMTMNVVLENTESDCREAARRWVKPDNLTGESEQEWLINRALEASAYRFKQLELNAQIVRFPSGLETEFAGQALYLLRVYGFESGQSGLELVEVPLENTPDVKKMRRDANLKSNFLDWIQANTLEIDNGTYLIPTPYLATEALSYSTLGINRLANKPFDVLFNTDDLATLPEPSGDLRWINSTSALVDRLNNGSCVGCHQASTTAGFHFLGWDDPSISGVTNRLALPFSAHFHRDVKRRRSQLNDFINNTDEDTFRPHSLAPDVDVVGTNQSCIPPRHRSHFQPSALWSCADDEVCEEVVESNVGLSFGQCMPAKTDLLSGQTCRTGTIVEGNETSDGVYNLHAYADVFNQRQRYDLPEDKTFTFDSLNCRPTRIGVPLGRTYRRCTDDERAFSSQLEDIRHPEICAVVGGAKFDSCVEKDFHTCLDSIVARGMVNSCHLGRFCREDYICQAMPYQLKGVDDERGKTVADAGVGFCTPTYFVFQLRLDGHPVP